MSAPLSLRQRGMAAAVIVAAISSAFAVLLMVAMRLLSFVIGQGDAIFEALAWVILLLALYVSSMVTANTFAVVVAERVSEIALRRLLGAAAVTERRRVASMGLMTGLVGSLIGLVLSFLLVSALLPVIAEAWGVSLAGFMPISPEVMLPVAVVILTTWYGAWNGARTVTQVTPVQALAATVPPPREIVSRRSPRTVAALLIGIAGFALLALGVLVGFVSPFGLVIAFLGGALSFWGIALGSTLIFPPVLALLGRAFGSSAVARLARENAMRYPQRSSRMALTVVMGCALVTMFAVGGATADHALHAVIDVSLQQDMSTLLGVVSGTMIALVSVCGVLAAVGIVNQLALGVSQRRRELALLRALGLSRAQIRAMMLLESVHLTLTSIVLGLALGLLYGWAGAQATFGSSPLFDHRPLAPVLPLGMALALGAGCLLLTAAASIVPTRVATRTSPAAALA